MNNDNRRSRRKEQRFEQFQESWVEKYFLNCLLLTERVQETEISGLDVELGSVTGRSYLADVFHVL